MAVARHQAVFGVQHGLRQAVRCQHQVALVRLVRPAQRHAVGTCDAGHALGEATGQLIQRTGFVDVGRDLVQVGQPFVFFFELRGLFLDPAFQAAVHRLQLARHVVEASGEGAEFVVRRARHACAQVAALDAVDRLLQQPHRFQDEAVAGVQQRRRAQHGQRHQRDLQQVHQRRPVRQVGLDAGDKVVNVGHEVGGAGVQHGGAAQPAAKRRPGGLHQRKTQAHVGVPGHEQRAFGVALAQQLQAVVESGHFLRQRRRRAGLRRKHQAVGLHAHAAGFVDGSGAAFELQRHPHQHRNGAQRHQQEGRCHE